MLYLQKLVQTSWWPVETVTSQDRSVNCKKTNQNCSEPVHIGSVQFIAVCQPLETGLGLSLFEKPDWTRLPSTSGHCHWVDIVIGGGDDDMAVGMRAVMQKGGCWLMSGDVAVMWWCWCWKGRWCGGCCCWDRVVVVAAIVVVGCCSWHGNHGLCACQQARPGVAQKWVLTGALNSSDGQPHTVVVVVNGGGGEWWWEEGMGRSQCVTVMMFQPWLLDLATHGCLLLINHNYYYF